MPRPQDYIITRPQLVAAIAELIADGTLVCTTGNPPHMIVSEIMYRRDLADSATVREAGQKWEQNAGNQEPEDHQDAGPAGS